MIDERFSATAFARYGVNSDHARQLGNELRDEILLEMRKVVEPAFRQIIERLRSLGHQLEERPHQAGHTEGIRAIVYGSAAKENALDWLTVMVETWVIALSGWSSEIDWDEISQPPTPSRAGEAEEAPF
jgi:hypothetical protein